MGALLHGKNAIVYGASGGVGSGVARTFAREGATVFLAGRTRATLEAVAADITRDGGIARVGVVDALDDRAVTDHVQAVVDEAGAVDVCFNLVSRGDVHGTPLLEMDVEDFMRPISAGARSEGSGVILMISSGSGAVLKASPRFQMGGTGPADAASESFLHYLAGEVGPRGVRVVGLWTAGVFHGEQMPGISMLGRGPTLQQLADTAAFVASDRGSGITASIVNVSSGVSAS